MLVLGISTLFLLNSFYSNEDQSDNVEFIYHFSFIGVQNRADAKVANDIVIRPYFNKVADFDEASETFEVVTTLDIDESNFILTCKKRSYEVTGFKKYVIE